MMPPAGNAERREGLGRDAADEEDGEDGEDAAWLAAADADNVER
jgi:hypothetical protein